MKLYFYTGCRWLIGLFVLVSGILYFLGLEKLPPLAQPVAQLVLDSLQQSGLFTLGKALEVAFGLAMITNRYVPLSLVIFFPITVFIAYFDIFLLHGDHYGYVTGGAMLAIHTYLLFAFLPRFLPMMAFRADPDLEFSALNRAPGN